MTYCEIVKLRHAAALALVGWYMMMPPIRRTDSDPNGHVDLKAPIAEWNFFKEKIAIGAWTRDPVQATVFPSREECEAQVQKARAFARKVWLTLHPTEDVVDRIALPWSNAKCFSTDDPRLKER